MSILERQRTVAELLGDDGNRTDIWRALSMMLPVDAYLNIGYSRRGWPHILGSPQRRLVDRVATPLTERHWQSDTPRLADLGCGRGGPAVRLAASHGFDVTGIDFLQSNVTAAAARAADESAAVSCDFIEADMTQIPVISDEFVAATAIDSLVYVPDKLAVFREIQRILASHGIFVATDLIRSPDSSAPESVITEFAEAWGMPPIACFEEYHKAVTAAGLQLVDWTTLSPHGLDRLGKWTRLYLGINDRLVGRLITRWLERQGLNPSVITRQIRAAHRALPALEHVLLTMQPRGESTRLLPVELSGREQPLPTAIEME